MEEKKKKKKNGIVNIGKNAQQQGDGRENLKVEMEAGKQRILHPLGSPILGSSSPLVFLVKLFTFPFTSRATLFILPYFLL